MFAIAHRAEGSGWAEDGIIKDAGDDPDVTHGALIVARVAPSAGGLVFRAGEGVGTVTRPGLPSARTAIVAPSGAYLTALSSRFLNR